MSAPGLEVAVGRVTGFRGTGGEVTVRVASGDAGFWTGMRRVRLRRGDADCGPAPAEIERARAYRDRLVLKLRGIDDPGAASALRGAEVIAGGDDVPSLPDGVYWVSRLIGALVVEEDGAPVGRVEEVTPTGGTDLLVVRDAGGAEILIPLACEIVIAVDDASRTIRVKLPEGLRDLNARPESAEGVRA